jgi:hypothetical protein
MLCSEREMMLSDDHDGIIDLPEDAPLGARFIDWKGLNDPMIHIKITPNRPDALGVRGIARDLAARGLGRLKPLDVARSRAASPAPSRADRPRAEGQGLPAVRRPPDPGGDQRPVARLAAGAAQGDRAAADLGAGRHHQLLHLRPEPPAACL